MSRERVKEYLKKYNMDNRIITVEGISATVKEAAEALGTKEERIARLKREWGVEDENWGVWWRNR